MWSWQVGFHRWSVVDVATGLGRGAKTDPHGWDEVGRLSWALKEWLEVWL